VIHVDTLALAWQAYPLIWLCEAFAIVWLTRRVATAHKPLAQVGRLMIVLGLALNAGVTQANSGVMPVVGMPSTFHPASSMWMAADSKHHLLTLADRASLYYFSVGDLILLVGGLFFLACWRGVGERAATVNRKT
jgi:hypothetical protein